MCICYNHKYILTLWNNKPTPEANSKKKKFQNKENTWMYIDDDYRIVNNSKKYTTHLKSTWQTGF